MWNKKREEEPPKTAFNPPPRPSPIPAPVAAPPPIEPKKEITPVSSLPMGKYEPPSSSSSAATIGKAVKVVGQIYSREDLYVDGEIEGTVEALEHKLTIGPNGAVRAGVKAREVVALGTIQGNVEAHDKIEIRKEAKLVGDIRTARIIIEDGAYFKGSIDIVKPEPKGAGGKPATPVAQATTPAPIPTPVATVPQPAHASAGAPDSNKR
jgi:cytoskeletal protein CcmA (bactofilin family)